MRLSRVYCHSDLEPGVEVILDGQAGHYLFRVLKLRAGDPLVLFNGDGFDYAAELISNRRDHVDLRVTARLPAVAESAFSITLVQAVGKGDRMDYSLQKSTELGVSAVLPLFSQRTEVRLEGSRLEKRVEHWRRVLISACEQSGRAVVPELLEPVDLDGWLAASDSGQRLVLMPGVATSLSDSGLDGNPVQVAVGPEGGFAELEMKQMSLAGVKAVSIGPRVLRTETAGPVAVALLQAFHGDLC